MYIIVKKKRKEKKKTIGIDELQVKCFLHEITRIIQLQSHFICIDKIALRVGGMAIMKDILFHFIFSFGLSCRSHSIFCTNNSHC